MTEDGPFDSDERPDPLALGGPLAWWRNRSPKAVAARLASRRDADELALLVERVRPAAREIARVLDRAEGPALVAAALDCDRPTAPRRTTLADDLLATAMLLDARCGNPTARVVVDHMRRRRGLTPLTWPPRSKGRSAGQTLDKPRPAPASEADVTPPKA